MKCKDHLANQRCTKNCIDTAANKSALKMFIVLGGMVPRQIGVVWWSCVSLCGEILKESKRSFVFFCEVYLF